MVSESWGSWQMAIGGDRQLNRTNHPSVGTFRFKVYSDSFLVYNNHMKIPSNLSEVSPEAKASLSKPTLFQYDGQLADHAALEEDCLIVTRRAPNGSYFIGRVKGTDISTKQGLLGKTLGAQKYGLTAFSKALVREGDGSIAVFKGSSQVLDELFDKIVLEPQASKLATSFDQPKILLPKSAPSFAM